METEKTERVDISRWNRKARRNAGQQMGGKLMGRNLPYIKTIHGSIENYNALRAKEVEEETKTVSEK